MRFVGDCVLPDQPPGSHVDDARRLSSMPHVRHVVRRRRSEMPEMQEHRPAGFPQRRKH